VELLFESRLEIRSTQGKIYCIQVEPKLHPEPVLEPDPSSLADGGGLSIYGSVLDDGGRLRMWYQAWPRDWDGSNANLVGYAESEDGITWRRPRLNLLKYGDGPNNLCDLNFHAPSVFIDPTAPSSQRYRATGWLAAGDKAGDKRAEERGYYTAHSADGLKWQLDRTVPQWLSSDVITSIYHPGQERGIAALKYAPRVRNIPRRSIWTAQLRDGIWSESHSALIPDDFDDICAISRGFASGDYYGMGMMAAGRGTVGFIWQFRHTLPRTQDRETGVFGAVDVSLAYQCREGDRWLHASGRTDFLRHGSFNWNQGGIYTASGPVDVADEQRLYFSGALHSHGWYVDSQWQISDRWRQDLIDAGLGRIGYAYWTKDRLFGFRADPEGVLELDLGEVGGPCELTLNYAAQTGGSVRVELLDMSARALTESIPLAGDEIAAVVAWQGGTVISPANGGRVTARLHMEKAEVYAYELQPVGGGTL
jgi:hypothetical protein